MEGLRFSAQSKPKNILVAVDTSERSLEAVRYAGRILPTEGISITLFHVLDLIPECFWDVDCMPSPERRAAVAQAWQSKLMKTVRDFMEGARTLLVGLGHAEDSVSVLIEERETGVARDIARKAQQGYDALVVGRRGMSDIKDLVFGSIANKLVTHLVHATVWVVGGQPDPGRVLIAMDGSDGAGRALEYVGSIFGPSHPEILLLHVTRGLDRWRSINDEGASLQTDWIEQVREEFGEAETAMNAVFERCIALLQKRGVDVSKVKTKIVPGVYSRAAAIFGEAQEERCGTIVVGRRGLSRVEEFLMGRVSNKVLQLAREMAVWVVH